MVPVWVMIICWAYLGPLVITQTNKLLVSAIKLLFLVLDVFTFLCDKLNFIVFFSHGKKISQILARKWNTLDGNGLAMVATWLK